MKLAVTAGATSSTFDIPEQLQEAAAALNAAPARSATVVADGIRHSISAQPSARVIQWDLSLSTVQDIGGESHTLVLTLVADTIATAVKVYSKGRNAGCHVTSRHVGRNRWRPGV